MPSLNEIKGRLRHARIIFMKDGQIKSMNRKPNGIQVDTIDVRAHSRGDTNLHPQAYHQVIFQMEYSLRL